MAGFYGAFHQGWNLLQRGQSATMARSDPAAASSYGIVTNTAKFADLDMPNLQTRILGAEVARAPNPFAPTST